MRRFVVVAFACVLFLGVRPAAATTCWDYASSYAFINAPTVNTSWPSPCTDCSSGSPLCLDISWSMAAYCGSDGDTGCTFCMQVQKWYWNAALNHWILSAVFPVDGGSLNCSSGSYTNSGHVYTCVNAVDYCWTFTSSLYSCDCIDVTSTTTPVATWSVQYGNGC